MAERRVIFPAGAKPVGPYSPGILAGDTLYVAGQGARDAGGRMPATFEDQARQCLDNIRTIVETAGFTMDRIVYSQVYLADIANYEAMNKVWARYFPNNPPARAVLGVSRMPTETPVEINAVAVKGESGRYYLPGVLGRDSASAMESAQAVMKAAGVDLGRAVFLNVYLDSAISTNEMNAVYRKYFEFGYTPARATIRVASLPEGAHIEITGVAVRDLRDRRVVRPKNMAPSPTASPCVFAGDTLYCSAKAGFIPGPNGGIFAEDVENQVRQTMRNLLDGLEEAGLDFSHVVATNVYLDQIDEFAKMNGVYGLYFKNAPPARTTVQPLPPVDRKREAGGRWPKLEEISLIAVR